MQAAGGAGLTGGVAESPDVGERTQAVTRNPFLDDSEESDTEEYKEVRDMVNPISGCIDVPRVNPLEVTNYKVKSSQ